MHVYTWICHIATLGYSIDLSLCMLIILVQLVARRSDFAGFFIQARAESNQDSVNSIVGTWTPTNNAAKTVRCNNDDRVSEL